MNFRNSLNGQITKNIYLELLILPPRPCINVQISSEFFRNHRFMCWSFDSAILCYTCCLPRFSPSMSLNVSHSLCSCCFLLVFSFWVLAILALCQLWQKCQTRLSTSFINIKTKLANFHLYSPQIFLPDFVSLTPSLAVSSRNYAFLRISRKCVCVSAFLVHFSS